MVRVGVISDTHFPTYGKVKLPSKIEDIFRGVDRIFHAGDVISPSVLKQLSKIAPVYAVKGNMDLSGPTAELPETIVDTIEGVKIGVIHGWGPPTGIEKRIRERLPKDVRCIVFGHTHSPMCEEIDGILFFNPGSATDKVYTLYNSVGILTIDNGKVWGEIVEI